jgi:O-antigen ligase/polysaccharide polymerase Wzy-like membrane protein
MPTIPWSDGVGVLFLKIGDTAVHLTAAGLFLLIFPDRKPNADQQGVTEKRSIPIYRLIGFVGWSLTAMISMAAGRTGLLDVMVPFFVVSVLKAQKIGWKVLALAVPVLILALMVLETNVVTVKFNGSRSLTGDQILANMGSLTGSSDAEGLDGTKEWRLIWWHNIINYTVFGPYFWTGKGFGVNLAQVDGPPGITQDEIALRSPHNGNMTVLARMGVPGILMWVALNFTFVFRLIKAYLRATRLKAQFWSNVNLWILCYWLGSFLNMSFDVYLEGPQGGIWFWSIIGLGVAALRVQSYELRQMTMPSRIIIHDSPEPEHSLVHA